MDSVDSTLIPSAFLPIQEGGSSPHSLARPTMDFSAPAANRYAKPVTHIETTFLGWVVNFVSTPQFFTVRGSSAAALEESFVPEQPVRAATARHAPNAPATIRFFIILFPFYLEYFLMRAISIGVPTRAVSIPIGSSAGLIATRVQVSAMTTSSAPPRAAIGNAARVVEPTSCFAA